MGRQILAVIDMQNDFIDGALGTKEAVSIVDKVADYIRNFDGEVVYTRDTHFEGYMDTQEGRRLPVPHCIKGTKGWEICDALKALQNKDTRIFDKQTFGSTELAEYLKTVSDLDTVVLVGLCTDICVISNAMVIKAYMPEVEIKVVENCCAGVTPESHANALKARQMCQVNIDG